MENQEEIFFSSRSFFNSRDNGTKQPRLTMRQRIQLRLFGRTKIGELRSLWRRGTPIYVAKCAVHGLFSDTPLGQGELLVCRECFRSKLVMLFGESFS
jgi:hypothetical protein